MEIDKISSRHFLLFMNNYNSYHLYKIIITNNKIYQNSCAKIKKTNTSIFQVDGGT